MPARLLRFSLLPLFYFEITLALPSFLSPVWTLPCPVRNNWGDYWGEDGFFRVERGVNALAIEEDCYYAEPKAWGHVETDGTSRTKSKNFDRAAVEEMSLRHLKKARSSRSAADLAALTGPAPLSIYAGYLVGLAVGAGLVVAAFAAGKRHERHRLYEMN